MQVDSSSLERLVPDELAADDTTGRATLDLHLERYQLAAHHARPGRLLDLACGVGYGTRLLAELCPGLELALGVDLSREAIHYARQRYAGGSVRFRVADAMTFSDADGFDTVVSLETLEHLPQPGRFFTRLTALLRPGGVLVASVPTTPSVDLNPHHRHDFSERSLRRLGEGNGLREIACLLQVQKVPVVALLRRDEPRLRDLRPNLPLYYLTHPGALGRRIGSTLRFGLANRYLTIVWQKPPSGPSASP